MKFSDDSPMPIGYAKGTPLRDLSLRQIDGTVAWIETLPRRSPWLSEVRDALAAYVEANQYKGEET